MLAGTGYAEGLAQDVFALNVSGIRFAPSVVDIADYDQDNLEQEAIVLFILATWTGGAPTPSAVVFHDWVDDMHKGTFTVQIAMQSLNRV